MSTPVSRGVTCDRCGADLWGRKRNGSWKGRPREKWICRTCTPARKFGSSRPAPCDREAAWLMRFEEAMAQVRS